MPMFMIMSGYYGMSTAQRLLKEILITCFTKLLVPFIIIISVLYRLEATIIYGSKFTLHLLSSPSFAMWFLLALIVYRISSKWLVKTKYYLVIAFVISISAIFVPSVVLEYGGIMRILSFMFFYYLGLYIKQSNINLNIFSLKFPKSALLTLVMVVTIYLMLILNYEGAVTLFQADDVNFFKELTLFNYLITRVGWYSLAILMSISIYSLVPQTDWLESIGKKSLSIYLGHVFLILILKSNTIKDVVSSLPTMLAWSIIVIETFLIIVVILFFNKLISEVRNR